MKKFTKVCLITGGVCVLIGGGITTVAAAMGGRISDVTDYRYGRLGRELAGGITQEITDDFMSEMDDLGRELSDDFDDEFDEFDDYAYRKDENWSGGTEVNSFLKEHARKLDLEVRRGRVVILPDSDSDEISVTSDSEMKGLSVYNEGDELKVSVGSKTWDTGDYSDTVVYIHVPADHRFEEAELKVKAQRRSGVTYRSNEGPVIAAEDLKAGKLEIDADVGSVTTTGADVGTLEVDSDVGAVKFEGNVDGNVDTECSVGAVKLDLAGEKSDYNYEIKCKVGSINVDGEGFSGLSSEKKINNGAAKQMELDCSTGAIDVKFH